MLNNQVPSSKLKFMRREFMELETNFEQEIMCKFNILRHHKSSFNPSLQ